MKTNSKKKWTVGKEELLIKLLKEGANNLTIENRLNLSRMTINKKMKEMGYMHLTDAREKLRGNSSEGNRAFKR